MWGNAPSHSDHFCRGGRIRIVVQLKEIGSATIDRDAPNHDSRGKGGSDHNAETQSGTHSPAVLEPNKRTPGPLPRTGSFYPSHPHRNPHVQLWSCYSAGGGDKTGRKPQAVFADGDGEGGGCPFPWSTWVHEGCLTVPKRTPPPSHREFVGRGSGKPVRIFLERFPQFALLKGIAH